MHPRSCPRLALAAAALLLTLAGTAGPARSQGLFGKNKVVYEHLEWQVLRTEHVEVFFYSQEEELARQLAAIAESTCAELDTTFRMRPRKRIPILTYSSHQAFQQTNATPGFISEGTGGLTELIKGRVLIPHTGSHHRLVWVTRHELVHAYMLEKIAQEQKEAKKYRGAWPPLWFTEGLAEFVSTRWDATAEGLLQDAVVNGVALPVTKSWDIEGTVLMYKEGQSFLEFAAERYGGRRRVLDLFEHWAEGTTFSEIWEKTFDEKLSDVDEAWFASLKRRYYPRVATRRPVKEIARAVTCCGQTFDLAPTVLPAAAPGDSALRLAYLSAEDGSVSLRLRVERGGKLVSDERVLRGGFSPRFESFHFFRSRLGASRDGRLAIVAQKGGGDVLHVVDPVSGRVLDTWSFPGIIGLSSPTWVAGDTTLVVVGQAVSGRTDLYRVRVADGAITALTDDAADDDDPTAHPTRPLVVFASDRESGTRGDHALFSMDLVTGAVEPLTSGPADDRRPVWSPDGTTLAFLSDREGIDDLWLFRDGRVQRASRFLGPAYDPAWHPDGKKLLFAGQAGWSFHLYEVPVSPVDSLWVDEDARAGLAGHPEAVRAQEAPGPYPRRLSMDIAQSLVALDPALGSGGGGGLVALSDVLGNEGLYLFLSNDASSLGGFLDGMEFGVTYFNRSQRLNYGVGVFRLARIYDVDFDLFRRERRIGASFMAAYPLSKFTRLEASTVVRYAQDHLLRSGEFRDLWLLSNFFAFVHDDARFTFYGAEGGHRINVTAGFTRDLSTGTGDDVSLTLDGRVYRSLIKDVVWANRVVTQASTGDDPERYYLGGPYALRGWDRRILWGTKTAFAQTELRFPILARTRLGAPLPIEFPRVNVALFADAAVAGELGQRFEKRGAVGAGLYVGGGYFPVLRLDFVKRSDLRTIQPKTRTQFSIGYSF
jgi:hypothetical protein